MRCLAFAYYETNLQDWNNNLQNSYSQSDLLKGCIDGKNKLPFILLGAMALKDNLRTTVKSAVKHARDDGRMSVRMISGDHVETAKTTAFNAGILEPTEELSNYAVMSAEDFEKKVGLNENE